MHIRFAIFRPVLCPWSRAFHEELLVAQLIINYPHWNTECIAEFTQWLADISYPQPH